MTKISKAAQQALDALIYHVEQTRPIERTTQAITALRAALQDTAGEVTVAIDNLYNERRDGMTNAIFPPVQIGTRLFAAQPAPVVPDDVVRYRTIRDGLAYIEPHESGEIYVAGETGVYTKSGDEFDAAIDAIAASQQKGWSSG